MGRWVVWVAVGLCAVWVGLGGASSPPAPPPPPPLAITPEQRAELEEAWAKATSAIPAPRALSPTDPAAATAPEPDAAPLNTGTRSTNTSASTHSAANLDTGARTPSTMTVVVPCVPRDLDVLEQNVLMHLMQQTAAPEALLVALSETNASVARQLEARWREHVPGVELRVLETLSKQTAGENRNRAGREARTEWVSFMDADDWMHPQRLEVVADVMGVTGAAAAVHSFSVGDRDTAAPRPAPALYTRERWRASVERNADGAVSTGQQLSRRWDHFIAEAQAGRAYYPLEAHGHVTVRRTVLDDVEYTDMERNEDTDFIKKIWAKQGKVVFVPLPLSEYTPSGVDGFFLNAINLWANMQANVFSQYNVTESAASAPASAAGATVISSK